MERQRQRPPTVTIIAILMIIVVIGSLIVGTVLVLSGNGIAHIDLLTWAMAMAIIMLLWLMDYGAVRNVHGL